MSKFDLQLNNCKLLEVVKFTPNFLECKLYVKIMDLNTALAQCWAWGLSPERMRLAMASDALLWLGCELPQNPRTWIDLFSPSLSSGIQQRKIEEKGTKICMDPSQKSKEKKSFLPALLARLQRTSSLTDRPVLFLSSFPAMEIAATPLSRCLFDGDAATQRISRCWSWQEGSSTFISLRRKEIAEKRCMNHTDSLGSSLKTLLVCLLARSVALLEVHLIYSKSILLLYSLQCMLIVYGDMASAWDGMRICFWHPRLISRKQYSELNGWLIKLINEAYMWWLPPASCIGLRFRLCQLQCMHHVQTGESPVKHDKDFPGTSMHF